LFVEGLRTAEVPVSVA